MQVDEFFAQPAPPLKLWLVIFFIFNCCGVPIPDTVLLSNFFCYLSLVLHFFLIFFAYLRTAT